MAYSMRYPRQAMHNFGMGLGVVCSPEGCPFPAILLSGKGVGGRRGGNVLACAAPKLPLYLLQSDLGKGVKVSAESLRGIPG